jgi:hypothetical protein
MQQSSFHKQLRLNILISVLIRNELCRCHAGLIFFSNDEKWQEVYQSFDASETFTKAYGTMRN